MPRKSFTPEQIIAKLRQIEVLISQGQSVAGGCRAAEISEQSYYRWRKEYGGMGVTQAKQLKELKKENQQLKRLVADLVLDKAMLEEADPRIRSSKQDELSRICNDPVAARKFLLHSSMIKTLERAASIG